MTIGYPLTDLSRDQLVAMLSSSLKQFTIMANTLPSRTIDMVLHACPHLIACHLQPRMAYHDDHDDDDDDDTARPADCSWHGSTAIGGVAAFIIVSPCTMYAAAAVVVAMV